MALLIATEEELNLLTKMQRRIYEKFRMEGWTKEEICKELRIDRETFRSHWHRARKTIEQHRLLTENPQYYLAKNQDVLR